MEAKKDRGYRSLQMATLLLLASVGMAAAADLYALGARVPVLAEPRLAAAKVAEAKRGDLLSSSGEEKGWHHVTYAGKSGWVFSLLVGKNPPATALSVLGDNNLDDLEGSARRRASSFTTAAAARGLSEDRTRLSQKYQSDYSGLAWMEGQEVPEEEAIRFIETKEKR
jgi:hypothetical protein